MTSSESLIVQLLNEATLDSEVPDKLVKLKTIQELLLHKDSHLLSTFLDDVLAFQNDRHHEIRKFVIGFIEESCKKDRETLPKVIATVQMLMSDTNNISVQKRAIQAMTHIYRVTLIWLSGAESICESMEAVWNVVSRLKSIILLLLDSENDGIRTHTIKFMENLILIQSHYISKDSASNFKNDFSLSDVPLTLKIARPRILEEEAFDVLNKLIVYHGSSHISSANLMTCMSGLVNIGKQRPQFLCKIVAALENLVGNLPPTLATSQVSSVRKHLKNQLFSLLKHPFVSESYFLKLSSLLIELGASKDEVSRALPKFEEMKRRANKRDLESRKGEPVKRVKSEMTEEDKVQKMEEIIGNESLEDSFAITMEKHLLERLTPALTTEIVLSSMVHLPSSLPPSFHYNYTPIDGAGTESQVAGIALLLGRQLALHSSKSTLCTKETEELESSYNKDATHIRLQTEVSFLKASKKTSSEHSASEMNLYKKKSRVRTLKLSEVTKPLSSETSKVLSLSALSRLLGAEKQAESHGVSAARIKIITSLVARLNSSELKASLLSFIFQNLVERSDLIFSWLYEEYCFIQGFHRSLSDQFRHHETEYNEILVFCINGTLKECPERFSLLRRLYLESPMITEDSIGLLKGFVRTSPLSGVSLMKDLVNLRPTKQLNFLNSLLEFTSHEILGVRLLANETILQLHGKKDLTNIIEEYSLMYLKFLNLSAPPSLLFSEERGRPFVSEIWNDDLIAVCLSLYYSLLPIQLKLLTPLFSVYVGASGDAKRIILRLLKEPLRSVTPSSPELLLLLENCPEGSEILITRIISLLLSENTTPPPSLVKVVRHLHATRFSDVRFLIPVLSALPKKDILTSLPSLIALSPIVLKEVFSRLLSGGALSPPELLFSLHTLESSDKQNLIRATGLCLADKGLFTQEVLVSVLSQLLDLSPLPLLLLRTMIQSLTAFPSLHPFINSCLSRLIALEIWEQKTLWSGFIKIANRNSPFSYSLLLTLPPGPLNDLLQVSSSTSNSELRENLLEHVLACPETQRSQISSSIMDVLYNKFTIPSSSSNQIDNETE